MNDAETLAAIRELAELRRKATPGPWRHGPLFWEGWADAGDGGRRVFEVPHVYPDEAHQPGVYVDPEIGREREPDAAFIAAAGSLDFDALLALLDAEAARHREVVAALREIEALHQPDPDGGMGFTADGYGSIDPACRVCGTSDEYAVRWPCATVLAARRVLQEAP